jgi:hypothetical protein
MEQAKQYLERYQRANDDEKDAIVIEYRAFIETLSAEDRQTARTFMQAHLRPRIEEVADTLDRLAQKATLVLKGKITYEGQEYVFGDWVTIADYCRLHNFKPARVQNWIDREIVPQQNVVIIQELNNLKLLKNVSYRPR